jgi:uncharacterized membrane protein
MHPWQIHPIFVHFTVGLLFTSSVLFIATAMSTGKAWVPAGLTAARWMFWSGILATLFTATAGFVAYFTVPDIDSDLRKEINAHAISAVVTAAIYLSLGFMLWRRQRQSLTPTKGWTAGVAIGIVSLMATGYLGGDLVFDDGVGVDAVHGGHELSAR